MFADDAMISCCSQKSTAIFLKATKQLPVIDLSVLVIGVVSKKPLIIPMKITLILSNFILDD